MAKSDLLGAPQSRDGERQTVARAQAGDVAAFEELYRLHEGRVFALCFRMASDRVRAQTLTQDVFVRCWERLSTFRGESSFAAWLYRLARNVVLEDMRREKRRSSLVAFGGEADTVQAPGVRETPDIRVDLEAAIAGLPEGARVAFILHDIEGYKHEEIARATGLAAGTIRAQLYRARQLLMKALTK